MNFELTDILKICGIMFIIVFSWYFVFVVFDTNKKYLKSMTFGNKMGPMELALSEFGIPSMNIQEGFDDKAVTKLENQVEQNKEFLDKLRKKLELDEDGKDSNKKLFKEVLTTRMRAIKLWRTTLCASDNLDKNTMTLIDAFSKVINATKLALEDYEEEESM